MSISVFEHPSAKIKIGTILFVVACKRSAVGRGERRALFAVGLSLPFLAVRLLYSVLMWFLSSSTFNFMDGNPTVELVMSVLEEFAVVIICTWVALTLEVKNDQRKRGEGHILLGSHQPVE
ncbi:hypothetical protein N7466_003939 [Penicillium verhagenii]|uniref:uncharacterized protein n=1 Tax=Penicillium verhagenii TaxID=1562060 RepID=UPI002544FB88|nr:uncharacterized protein N7466_003939 [Penicillium verhagenii]KAJ5934392.1 hypothetical protein N7466_003939 [Penicillium verhagenii]